jgi:hypothetical protein
VQSGWGIWTGDFAVPRWRRRLVYSQSRGRRGHPSRRLERNGKGRLIYICIPTHNEQQTVGVVLWKLRQILTDFPRDYQLLVVDDASTDKTAEVLEPYARVLPLTVVRSERQLGYGASLELLLREAVRRSEYPKRDAVVTLQADFSEEPDDLVPLVKRLEAGADVAIGNKVGKEPVTRLRRYSRALARFFTRRVKWPEGVETPFDGYRAYRLYAVKRALEEQPGRLIRHDGWAAHAELLRRVMPHARRVDVVDVVDRTDRLQRERRERPFASALAVRSMSRGRDPAGLATVEELDRIAATAVHHRAGPTLAEEVARNGRSATRTNGARRTDGRGRSGPRNRAQSRRDEGGAEEGGREGRNRPRGRARDANADDSPQRKSRSRPRRAPSDTATAEPAAAGTAAAAAAGSAPVEENGPGESTEPRPKRRRRRRRKSGSAGATAGDNGGTKSAPEGADPAPAAPDAVAGTGTPAGEAGGAGEPGAGEQGTGERKRRRRGGRRGGRGRRRKPRADGDVDAAPRAEGGSASGIGADGETRDSPAD